MYESLLYYNILANNKTLFLEMESSFMISYITLRYFKLSLSALSVHASFTQIHCPKMMNSLPFLQSLYDIYNILYIIYML